MMCPSDGFSSRASVLRNTGNKKAIVYMCGNHKFWQIVYIFIPFPHNLSLLKNGDIDIAIGEIQKFMWSQ